MTLLMQVPKGLKEQSSLFFVLERGGGGGAVRQNSTPKPLLLLPNTFKSHVTGPPSIPAGSIQGSAGGVQGEPQP